MPTFVLSPGQRIEKTNAIGIYVNSGRYGGTFAHKDIAFEFCSAISPIFKLYLIKEFQRLKENENDKLKLEWNLQRTLSKINYKIHTEAIKENLLTRWRGFVIRAFTLLEFSNPHSPTTPFLNSFSAPFCSLSKAMAFSQ